jgi:hypothetical protein
MTRVVQSLCDWAVRFAGAWLFGMFLEWKLNFCEIKFLAVGLRSL